MRYSFHGKVRATGQQVDGFVEASNATQAIDRLADQGIIGVYTVRPEPKAPKNAVILAGQEPPEVEEPARRPRLEKPRRPAAYEPAPVLPPPVQPAPVAAPPAVPMAEGAEAVLVQLVEKVSTLMAQVEKLLARPAQVVYASGPARGSGGGGSSKKSKMMDDAQNSTLRDIFMNNMDLRKSLEKLATTVGPTAGPTGPTAPRTNGEAGKSNRDSVPNGRDLIQAQPAA